MAFLNRGYTSERLPSFEGNSYSLRHVPPSFKMLYHDLTFCGLFFYFAFGDGSGNSHTSINASHLANLAQGEGSDYKEASSKM